ncbi:MAG: universal stress protein [Desulfofustis sp.]|jgi:nucleotide-binding universal stress UspA family protein|nr:universal stress protein [Desulfofustis sp.]
MKKLPGFNTILYATDLGEHMRPVFRTALDLAVKYQAQIIMLHVVEPMSSAIQAVVDTYLTEIDAKKVHQDGMREVLQTMKRRLSRFCEEELGSQQQQDLRVKEVLVVSGRPSEEIVKAAGKHGADLIVLGKATHHVFGSEVAGSTARRVTRHSNIPVLIVPNV